MSGERRRPGRSARLAGNVAAAVRRRQQEREPRVVLYDAAGHPRVLPPGASGYDRLVDLADELIALGKPR